MPAPLPASAPPPSPPRGGGGRAAAARRGDRRFKAVSLAAASSLFLLVAMIGLMLVDASWPALTHFGWRFLTTSTWDPVSQHFGALPFIAGTALSAIIAMLIAVPVGVGTAVYLTEFAPGPLRSPVAFLVELLAAIPSIVYGLWGLFVMAPWIRDHVETPLSNRFGGWHVGSFYPFGGAPYGYGMLSAGLILAIMVLPIVTAVSREVLLSVPASQREGSLSLGATRWEAVRSVILPYASAGIIGAIGLGFGRAIGETMAVTMVVGNAPTIPTSLFDLGNTLASVIASQLNEASGTLHRASLLELGLLLFVIALLVNVGARLLVLRAQAALGRIRA